MTTMKPKKANRMPIKSICAYCGECACTKSSCKDIKQEEDDFVEWQRLKYAKQQGGALVSLQHALAQSRGDDERAAAAREALDRANAAMTEYKREQEWLHDQIDRCSQTEEETAEGEEFFDQWESDERLKHLHGCQFPHQCGHRNRICESWCPNNPPRRSKKKHTAAIPEGNDPARVRGRST